MFTTECFMSLRSRTDNEIALTLALSHQNGRGNFLIQGAPNVNPRPLAGEGRVRVWYSPNTVFSKEDTKITKVKKNDFLFFVSFVRFVVK
jgi:hypothetical protein